MLYENLFTELFLKIDDPKTILNFISACKLFYSIGTLHQEIKKIHLTICIRSSSKIYHILPNGTLHGLYQLLFQNGTIRKRLNYKNGFKHGLSQKFYPNGQIFKQIYYINNKYHGSFFIWNKKGILLESKFYHHGLKHGLMEYYDMSGQLYKQVNYRDGIKQGRHLLLYHDGSFSIKHYFNNNEKFLIQQYNPSGILTTQFTLLAGLLNGLHRTY